jgi:hypothetical protein
MGQYPYICDSLRTEDPSADIARQRPHRSTDLQFVHQMANGATVAGPNH